MKWKHSTDILFLLSRGKRVGTLGFQGNGCGVQSLADPNSVAVRLLLERLKCKLRCPFFARHIVRGCFTACPIAGGGLGHIRETISSISGRV